MKARPILFQGDMVRAILDGRKTQTRRIVKPQPPLDELGDPAHGEIVGPEWYEPAVVDRQGELVPGEAVYGAFDTDGEWGAKCPYGQPGDLLWVREKFAEHPDYPEFFYAADGDEFIDADGGTFVISGHCKPSIHMRRKLSRLTLRVTGVRVERLHDIKPDDIRAEGVELTGKYRGLEPADWEQCEFADLWESINGPDSWRENLWVWVIEFEPIRANVDTILSDATDDDGNLEIPAFLRRQAHD